ncbi:hypothetical protein P9112_009969 [Eukaryota sp. TZLM1-RC]
MEYNHEYKIDSGIKSNIKLSTMQGHLFRRMLVPTVQNTSAYKEFSKSISNTRSRPSRRKRRSDNINNNINPTPIRPRRSKRRKGSVSLG